MKRVEKAIPEKRKKWHGFELQAIDKCTLILPESKELYKKYGAHRGDNGIGPINVEICCIFNALARIPKRLVISPCRTSEFSMIELLMKYFDHRHLLLIDNGFYSLKLFVKILARKAEFIIPMAKSTCPRVLKTLGAGDYLCEIKSALTKERRNLRVIYVYRKGFRRRRLLTSLLDPVKYPADEIAAVYHQRWTVETFYREFKSSMEGKRWHCRTVHAFKVELIAKMVLACMVRLAGADAAKLNKIMPEKISFSKTLTEFKCFLRKIVDISQSESLQKLYSELIKHVKNCRLQSKSGRSFSRDKQQYRRKSRGLNKKRGRPKKIINDSHKPETATRHKMLFRSKLPFTVLLS